MAIEARGAERADSRPLSADRAVVGRALLAETLPEALRPRERERTLRAVLVWGDEVLDVRDLAPNETLTLGTSARATFQIPSLGRRPLPVLRPLGNGGFQALLPPGIRARLGEGPLLQEVDELVASGRAHAVDVPFRGAGCLLGLHERLEIRVGELRLVARYVRPSPMGRRSVLERLDADFLSLGVMLLLGALTLERMFAITLPEERRIGETALVRRPAATRDRVVKTLPPLPARPVAGERPAGPEGRFGPNDRPQVKAAPGKAGSPQVARTREDDMRLVRGKGILAVLDQMGGGPSAQVFGREGIGRIGEMMGGVDRGGDVADSGGVRGLGSRGGGAGGGGDGIDIGRIGVPGGSPDGRGFDLGPALQRKETRFVPSRAEVTCEASRDVVGRTVRKHWNEIKYCYEKELAKDPNLAGKVTIAFDIGPLGDVTASAVKDSTLQNGVAEECIRSAPLRWRFPAPQGCGVVQVVYPFIFAVH